MVHQKLISEGKVQPLTYSQLRRLERMDMKKAREQKLLELAGDGVEAFGRTMQGPITGPVLLALGLTAFYPEWSTIVGTGAAAIAADIGKAWKSSLLPAVESLVGRDDTNGRFGVGITSNDGLSWLSFAWFTDPGSRNAALVVDSVTNPLHAEAVDRTGSAATGWTIPATSLATAQFKRTLIGKWGVYNKDGVLISIAATETEAKRLADLFTSQTPYQAPITVNQI